MRPRWAQLLAMCCLRNAQPFQFMHSVGSATGAWCSIGQRTAYFNSCAPRWAQPLPKHKPIEATLFQFMHPVWDATKHAVPKTISGNISIHASRMGCNCKI